jgi:hypothetical protein
MSTDFYPSGTAHGEGESSLGRSTDTSSKRTQRSLTQSR